MQNTSAFPTKPPSAPEPFPTSDAAAAGTADAPKSAFDVVSSSNTREADAGNRSLDHYKSNMPAYRYRLRTRCLPIVRKETEVLAAMQSRIRTPLRDFYFAWSANLASHTFYVLMLPAANWFGSGKLARDLVFVLGMGIYLTGNLKDFLCLPRPRSPPIHRITMSSYTTQEYGFPSSHSANATAVTLTVLGHFWGIKSSFPQWSVYFILVSTCIYYVSLIFGRLYCGMHGFFDILTGSVIGLGLFLLRFWYGDLWDQWFIYHDYAPAVILGFYLMLIHTHFEPVDDCPCFDDSVAFIGVLIGLDLSHHFANKTQYFASIAHGPLVHPIVAEYDFSRMGVFYSVLRVICGILLVVAWKSISKPVIFTILPPVYKWVGVNIPRRNYKPTAFSHQTNRQIRKLSVSNLDEPIGDLKQFIKGVTDHDQKDQVGPETDIDVYAMLDSNDKAPDQKLAGVFKPRYDVEIVGRLIVYAGVSTMSVWGFAVFTHLVGLT